MSVNEIPVLTQRFAAYDMFTGVTKDGMARSIHGRTTLVFLKQSGQWKIVSAHFSAMP